LEGFCSTIELHPLARPHCHLGIEPVNRQPLTRSSSGNYNASRMMHLNTIAAAPTAHLWWRAQSLAARWRD
jgi:hypothetical protein